MRALSHLQFTPQSLNPVLWIDASRSITLADGANVGIIADLTPSGNHLTQTDSARPVFDDNVWRGRPGLRCELASGIGMNPNNLSLSGSGWAMFIAEYSHTLGGGGGSRTINSPSANRLMSLAREDGNNCFFDGNISNWGPAVGRSHVSVFKTGPQYLQFWVDGINRTVNNTANAPFGPVGFGNYGVFPEPPNTTILEAILFNRQLSDGERLLLENYLMSKHGVIAGKFIYTATDAVSVSLTGGQGLRADFDGFVGGYAYPNRNVMISHLGRYVHSGQNNHSHRVVLSDFFAQTLLAEVTIPSGAPTGWNYIELPMPVSVINGQPIAIASREVAGGDSWYGLATVTGTADFGNWDGIYAFGDTFGWIGESQANKIHVPVSFKYY